MTSNRSFLFLQGVASPFFDRLAYSLRRSGVNTCRVIFCGGDAAFHRRGNSKPYLGALEDLPEFYYKLFIEMGVSDLVLFGDSRPVHIPAIKLAKQLGINVHVYEEGYLRPDWITLDSGGVNANSSLSKKSTTFFRQMSKGIARGVESKKTGYNQWVRLFHDIRYNSSRILDAEKFPNYNRHRVDHPIREYLGWFKRYPTLIPLAWYAKYRIRKLIDTNTAYYVYPLQLSGDSQIRVHSGYDDVNEATAEILHSFKDWAPKGAYLVVKNHPLDTGVSKGKQFTMSLSRKLGIQDRVVFLEGGHLPTLLSHTRGTVVINSTTGMSALYHRSPTIALGKALYDLPGLTHQGGLNDFWHRPRKVDYKLFRDFRDVLVHKTQINGNFYTMKGIEMAVSASMDRFGIPVVNDIETRVAEKPNQVQITIGADVVT